MKGQTYRVLDDHVHCTAFDVVRVVKVFDCDKLLKRSPGEFRLFDEIGLSTRAQWHGWGSNSRIDGRWMVHEVERK